MSRKKCDPDQGSLVASDVDSALKSFFSQKPVGQLTSEPSGVVGLTSLSSLKVN